jgi:23S rRNA maturation mini-RNase III
LHDATHRTDYDVDFEGAMATVSVAIYESYIRIIHVENVDIKDRPSDQSHQDQSETVHQELTLFEIGNSLSKITATVTNRTKTKRTCRLELDEARY